MNQPEDPEARLRRLCERFLGTVRHSVELGMKLEDASSAGGATVRLVHNERIVGNPWNGVVHGGPILALLDQTGGLAVACRLFPDYDITPTLDLRIDHLKRPEPGLDFIAWAECFRLTSNVAFVRGCAYQTGKDDPVSTYVATYMRLGLNKSMVKKPMTEQARLIDVIGRCRAEGNFDRLVDAIPYARFLGMRCVQEPGEEDLTFLLPAQQDNIGNPTLPALHGGAIGGFMEHAAIIHLLATMGTPRMPKTIDLSIDYLRAGHYRDCRASCTVTRQGRRVANVLITCWQEDRREPIAHARALLLADPDAPVPEEGAKG